MLQWWCYDRVSHTQVILPTHLEGPGDVGHDSIWLQPSQCVHSTLALGIHLRVSDGEYEGEGG